MPVQTLIARMANFYNIYIRLLRAISDEYVSHLRRLQPSWKGW